MVVSPSSDFIKILDGTISKAIKIDIRVCDTPESATSSLKEGERFAAIILDLDLDANHSGDEYRKEAARLAMEANASHIPIILVADDCGRSITQTTLKGFYGAIACVTKGSGMADIMEQIRIILFPESAPKPSNPRAPLPPRSEAP